MTKGRREQISWRVNGNVGGVIVDELGVFLNPLPPIRSLLYTRIPGFRSCIPRRVTTTTT